METTQQSWIKRQPSTNTDVAHSYGIDIMKFFILKFQYMRILKYTRTRMHEQEKGHCHGRSQAGRRSLDFKISASSLLSAFSSLKIREMKLTEVPIRSGHGGGCDGEVVASKRDVSNNKPQFRPAIDDTKPLLQDPILRSDPIETEEAVLRLPPFPPITSSSQ